MSLFKASDFCICKTVRVKRFVFFLRLLLAQMSMFSPFFVLLLRSSWLSLFQWRPLLDLLLPLAGQIPSMQRDPQHSATHLFSFDFLHYPQKVEVAQPPRGQRCIFTLIASGSLYLTCFFGDGESIRGVRVDCARARARCSEIACPAGCGSSAGF